jgi:hypothetical protein
MGNLGNYQALTTVAKQVGGPTKLVVGILAVGTGIGITGTLGVQKIKKFINEKRNSKNSFSSETQEQNKPSRFAELIGKYEGQIFISDDFDEPLEEFKDYM